VYYTAIDTVTKNAQLMLDGSVEDLP
jgi:hypothetical protein